MTGKRILAVLAHPDDESFGLGAGLARLSSEGHTVILATATGGESGTVPGEMMREGMTIADIRAAELRCAAAKLGIREVIFLGYLDSGMEGAPDNAHSQALIQRPVDEVAGRIAELIGQVRPHVILTHDEVGGYFHPDHIALHKASLAAFEKLITEQSPALPQRLLYHLIPRGLIRLMAFILPILGRDPRRFGQNQDIDLARLARVWLPVHVRMDVRRWRAIQDQASACHVSQTGGSLTGEDWQASCAERLTGMTFICWLAHAGKRILRHVLEGLDP